MKLSRLGELICKYQARGTVLIITDSNVAPLYLNEAISSIKSCGLACDSYTIPSGEESKSFETYIKIIEYASLISLTRTDGIVALGGGMVGDIAGFVAATYMRGINFYQVPTTLLAAVDSSVGGKSAINTCFGKNLVGAFHKAKFVLQDTALLASEDDYVLMDGYAEIIKTACISRSDDLFEKLESGNFDIQEIIDDCVAVKTYYVEKDENDSGIRHMLNYGHTLAHALEKLSSYEIGHGHAVAKGIAFTASLSYDLGWCSIECRDRIHALLEKFGYDLSIDFPACDIANAMAGDKKRAGDAIKFIVSSDIGQSKIKLITLAQIGEILATYSEICPESAAISHRGAPLFAPTRSVSAPPSKSYLHREIIAAMLSGSDLCLDAKELSDDIIATYEAVKQISAHGRCTKPECTGPNSDFTEDFPMVSIDCKESGSTLRFLLPVVTALGLDAEFMLSGSLIGRPIEQLIIQLENHGSKIIKDDAGSISVTYASGYRGLSSGEFIFTNPESSQFISGLLFALPILDGDSTIDVYGKFESSDYVMITLDVLEKYGVKIEYTHDETHWSFKIRGNQRYKYKLIPPEGDWSNAAFLLALGALGKAPLRVQNLPIPSKQGDAKILDLLKAFGVTLNCYEDIVDSLSGTVDVFPCRKLTAIPNIDASEFPDLVPIISLVASISNDTTVIYNAERLRYKESDRLASTCHVLKALGANITETEDKLIIVGTKALHGAYEGDGYGDHRIIMMLAVSSLVTAGTVKIHEASAASKSFPNFFEVLNKLGLDGNTELA